MSRTYRNDDDWFRAHRLSDKEIFERIRVWDYVDGVHHCIDLSDNEVKLEPIEKIERCPTLVDMENTDLMELYEYQKNKNFIRYKNRNESR